MAKLCQQTSSVLASVLPAPFGGHKRSILCQFFGQVHVPTSSKKQANQVKSNPHQLPSLQQQQQLPTGGQVHGEPESIAILQQHRQPPITLLATGKHPIRLVLEQQQRQQQLQQQHHRLAPFGAIANLPIPLIAQDQLINMQQATLRAHSPVEPPKSFLRQQHHARPSQRPKQQVKFSSPLATSVQPASSASDVASSGWRIYNTTIESSSPAPSSPSWSSPLLVAGETQNGSTPPEMTTVDTFEVVKESPSTRATTAAYELKISEQQIQPASKPQPQVGSGESSKANQNATSVQSTPKPQPTYQRPKTVVVVAGEQSKHQQTSPSIGKRTSESLKSTTKATDLMGDNNNNNTAIRTIEVSAQTNANLTAAPELLMSSSSVQNTIKVGQPKLQIINLSEQQLEHGQDSTNKSGGVGDANRQVQKREELVIASINNLTRIAFGNQLRDTVKVINKLIDQQADIFSTSAGSPKKVAAAAANLDPMLASDSVERHQVVAVNAVSGGDKPNKSGDKFSHKKSKVSNNKTTLTSAGSTIGNKSTARPTSTTSPTNDDAKLKVTNKAKQFAPTSGGSISSRAPQRKPTTTTTTTTKPNKVYTNEKNKQSQVVKSNNNRETTSTFGRIVAPYKPTRLSAPSSSRTGGSSGGRNYELAGLTGHELRRLTTVGRSLSTISGGQTNGPSTSRAVKFTSRPASDDLQSAATVDDINRDHKRRQQTTPRALQSTRQQSSATSAWRHQPTSNVVTQFPWLLPEKNALNSDLFASGSVQDARSSSAPVLVDLPSKKWTTRKSDSDHPPNKQSQAALNRIESTPKMTRVDSLTTLKMSLLSSTTRSPVGSSTTTRLPFSTGTQSRWIPSTMFATRPAPKTTTSTTASPRPSSSLMQTETSPVPTISSTTASNSPATVRMQASSSPAPTTVASSTRHTGSPTEAKPMTSTTLSEFNEARASDSISKYTTHLNEANELLATTARRHLYAQPLPQIAQTGEYFSAETIASWPERYQTMMSKALEEQTAMSSTRAMETTRRNGESYEFPSSSSTSTTAAMARHRVDTSQPALADTSGTEQQMATTRSLASTSLGPGITILPSNHKLVSSGPLPTTIQLNEEQDAGGDDDGGSDESDDENDDSDTTNSMLAATTLMMQQATETPPTTLKDFSSFTSTTKHEDQQPATSYTFAIPNNQQQLTTMGDENGAFSPAPSRSFPRVLGDLLLTSSSTNDHSLKQPTSSNASNLLMRPPYHQEAASSANANEHLMVESLAESTLPDPTLVLDSSQTRPQVSRKLYDLLVPGVLRTQNQSVVSPFNYTSHQPPISPHRFNLSALKYLAQTLLNPSGGRPSNESSQNQQEANATMTATTTTSNEAAITPQRLIDLLNGNIQSPASSHYYDLLLNETASLSPSMAATATTASGFIENAEQAEQVDNTTSTGGRQTIFGRAGNLLNDLKQLEQRRAAAILAAIRYQVPSPLVKPWDVNSDLWIGQQPQSILSRLDDYLTTNGSSSQGGLFINQLGKAIKSSRLFKQRFVPRQELEARLNGASRGSLFSSSSSSSLVAGETQRRSDRMPTDDELGDQVNANGTSLDQLRYLLAANQSNSMNKNSLLEKLLLPDGGHHNDSQQISRDFELINLSSNHTAGLADQTESHEPKYMGLSNQRKSGPSSLLVAPEATKMKSGATHLTSSDLLGRQQMGSSEVAARLRLVATSRQDSEKKAKQVSRKDPQQQSNDNETTNNQRAKAFDCNGRPSGLYPDFESACRVSETSEIATSKPPK